MVIMEYLLLLLLLGGLLGSRLRRRSRLLLRRRERHARGVGCACTHMCQSMSTSLLHVWPRTDVSARKMDMLLAQHASLHQPAAAPQRAARQAYRLRPAHISATDYDFTIRRAWPTPKSSVRRAEACW